MKLHPRMAIVAQARYALSRLLLDLERKHALTFSDLFALLSDRTQVLATGAVSTATTRLTATTSIAPCAKARLARAHLEFVESLRPLQAEHALTYGEWFSLLGNAITDLAKYQIRTERHPGNPDKKGDEA